MTLYIIGIGLSDEKDITIKGLEIVRKCDRVYLENYTSLLQCTVQDLAKFYGRELVIADRIITEQGNEIINNAKTKEVAFLVIGDPFSATTHIDLMKRAKGNNVRVKIINNASVLTAVGITGLQLYKFGKITSIPFVENCPSLETPYTVLKENKSLGLHTLFMLDLNPSKNQFMTINQAINILESIENRKKEGLLNDETIVVGCARIGSYNPIIKAGKLKEIKEYNFGLPPHCLIIPGKMHFLEEEFLKMF